MRNRNDKKNLLDVIMEEKDYWITSNGFKYKVEELTNSHLVNCALYMIKNCERIKSQCEVRQLDNVEVGTVGMSELLTEIDSEPLKWIEKTRIYKLLTSEIGERGLFPPFKRMKEKAIERTD